MDFEKAQAVRKWIVRAITLNFDNEERIYSRLVGVAQEAVRDDMGTGVGRSDYEVMLRGHGGRYAYVQAVGRAVRDELLEVIHEHCGEDEQTLFLLIDLLDLHDNGVSDLLGEHYLPEDADEIEWDED